MLDFTKIVADVAGQRETFEELVCQIARRSPPSGHNEFRRIHGAGGDGGVEAVWILENGEEHGYQAKFYTKSGDVDWSAIDKSVEAALATHPKLTVMTIVIACALTGRTRRLTKSGRPQANGWDAWDDHKVKWEASATALGRKVSFEPWMAPDLEDMLVRPEMVGLVDRWFGGIELSPAWLNAQCQRTIAGLEERYHPEDHVDVSTASLFDGLLRNGRFRALLEDGRAKVLEYGGAIIVPTVLAAREQKSLVALAAELQTFRATTVALETTTLAPFDYPVWRKATLTLLERVLEIIQPASELARALDAKRSPRANKGKPPKANTKLTDLKYAVDTLRKLQSALETFIETLNQLGCFSDERRFALLDGRAGSGKSHLIASQIELAVAEGAAVLFVLGTNFTLHGSIENQLLAHFELGAKRFDELLGALNAHAEARGVRALIAIDAVNEGAGVQLWRGALQGFAQRILAFPYLALCVSCRREYIDRLVTPAVTDMVARADIAGFETPEEMEAAAQVYMDRRGIVRPATPWLNPEFSNPLFLRTACLALERDGRTTFPRGMRGTSEVLNFFLETTGRHLGTEYDGADTLVLPVRRALLALAGLMAKGRQDFVTRTQAHVAVEGTFQGFAPTPGKTWLELLRFRGLLRYDPNPAYDPSDPLSDQDDVVRFSFQRFQDHLIANFLLERVKDPSGLFDPSGTLGFVLGAHGVEWQWRGLFYALYLHCADRYHVELVDVLPGGADKWWNHWVVQDAFVESVRWRTGDAFTDRSLELLNRLNDHGEDVIALLIELGAIEEHAWNAEFLERNLTRRKLPDRDAFWTVQINDAHNQAGHSLSRLVTWCLNPGVSRAEDGPLGLALILLGWACASTSASVRDTATKAIVAIFLERPKLIEPFFKRFSACDDPYVIERLYAALYGASLRTLDPKRLGEHALIAWTHAFAGQPPVHIVSRDYARGTVELAFAAGTLDASIDLARCRPPYHAPAPIFNVTEARVEARSKRVGADSILRSCYQGLADFGKYTLQNRVERFAAAPLAGPRPLTAAETGQAFLDDVSKGRDDVAQAFEALRDAYRRRRVQFDPRKLKVSTPGPDQKRVDLAEQMFLGLLTSAQAQRYRTDAEQWASGTDRNWIVPGKGVGKPVDAHRAKLWVANRAIAYGWTAKRFPHDRTRGERENENGRIERIGKKYQRMAMMELLARLADNNWLKPDWGVPAKAYDNLLDVEFLRGVEPSILPADVESPSGQGIPKVPSLRFDNLPASDRKSWVFDPELAPEKLALALGADLGDDEWLTLYRFASHDIDIPRAERSMDVPWQQSEFYYLTMVLTRSSARQRLIDETSQNEDDFHDWLPGDYTDGPFIGELGRRDTWPKEPWFTVDSRGSATLRQYEVVKPTVGYRWESHLDKSLADGFSRQVPIPWLISALGLIADSSNRGVFTDPKGTPVIVSASHDHHRHVLVRREALLAMARQHDLEPVWTIIGERIAVTNSSSRTPDIRVRYNGLLWLDGGQPKVRYWARPD